MDFFTIEFDVTGQKILNKKSNINQQTVSDSINYLKLYFNFTDDWFGDKFVLFYKSENANTLKKAIEVKLIPDDNGAFSCIVPPEIIKSPRFAFSPYVINDGEQRITTELYIMPVKRSGFSGETIPPIEYMPMAIPIHTPADIMNAVKYLRFNSDVIEWSNDGENWTALPSNGGVSDHEDLTGRDAANQHPISAITGLQGELDSIADLIPTQASPSNQLADKAFTNSSIANMAANYVTPDSLGEQQWASLDDLRIGPWYNGGAPYAPSQNDYAIYIETDGSQWRAGYNGNLWSPTFKINDSGFTSAQLAALNSNITNALVQMLLNPDVVPTSNSGNLITSGAVFDALPKPLEVAEAIVAMPTSQWLTKVRGTVTKDADGWGYLDFYGQLAVGESIASGYPLVQFPAGFVPGGLTPFDLLVAYSTSVYTSTQLRAYGGSNSLIQNNSGGAITGLNAPLDVFIRGKYKIN